jgi:hypothetical protein
MSHELDAQRRKGIAQVIANANSDYIHGVAQPPHDDMAGKLLTVEALRRFLLAGKAIITVKSKATGTRFTFRFERPATWQSNSGRERPIWVNVLSGPDNDSDYIYLGTVWIDAQGIWAYRHGAKSRVDASAVSVKAARWLISIMQRAPDTLFLQAEVWHEGRCGRCGRRLTVPSSIASGFGPECEGKL